MTDQTTPDEGTETEGEAVMADPSPWSPLSDTQMQALMARLNGNRVAKRDMPGGKKQMSYVEAWDIRATLIRIFGFGGFSIEVDSKILDIRDDGRQGVYTKGDKIGQPKTPYVMAHAKVRLTIHGIGPQGQDVVYDGSAVGTNDGFTIGDVADNAIKSAESDALKRAAINLGTQFGLSLYQNGSTNDVVRMVLQPVQAAQIERFRQQAETARQEAQRMIDRATQVDEQVASESVPESGTDGEDQS